MPYMVMVRCPNADKAVPTGVTCDLAAFSKLTSRRRFRCPECGGTHAWSAKSAWLRDRAYAMGQLTLPVVDILR